MPRICYIDKKFRRASMVRIAQATDIIHTYSQQGHRLTLRQLYYRLVAKDLIPNTMRDYKKLGTLINDARLAGLIDWAAIEDRTRNLRGHNHWDDPADIIDTCANQWYHRDKWEDQPTRVEVWVEKDALVGIIGQVAYRNDIDFFSTRGYCGQSEMWTAAMRFKRYVQAGQDVVLLHLSDHDPSGIDMTRDIDDRINDVFGVPVDVRRIALTMEQVRHYNPPPNPAKQTDSRFEDYVAKYGDESWELDALEPAVLDALIQDHINGIIDRDLFDAMKEQEDDDKDDLRNIASAWRSGDFDPKDL